MTEPNSLEMMMKMAESASGPLTMTPEQAMELARQLQRLSIGIAGMKAALARFEWKSLHEFNPPDGGDNDIYVLRENDGLMRLLSRFSLMQYRSSPLARPGLVFIGPLPQ